MNLMYICDVDGTSNKVEFEYNPKCDLFPNFEVHAKEYWSVPGWDDDTGELIPPIYSITNFGGSEVGGLLVCSFNYMSPTKYAELVEKYKAGADQLFRRYFSGGLYKDYKVSIYRFPQEPISGIEGVQWKLELKIVEVIA